MSGSSVFIVLALASAWLLQIMLSSWQMMRFHKQNQKMRRLGTLMATGVAGSMYRRKIYATVVADDDHRVVAAGRLAGSTIAAGMKPVDEIVGMHIDQIGEGEPPAGVKQKTWDALGHAAGFIRAKIAKEAANREASNEGEGT